MENSQVPQSPEEIWKMALSQIQLDLSPIAYKTWFNGSQLIDITDNIIKIGFNTGYIKDYVETHYRTIVKRALAKATGNEEVEPIFEVTMEEQKKHSSSDYSDPIFSSKADEGENPMQAGTSSQEPSAVQTKTQAQPQSDADQDKQAMQNKARESGLNPRYSLESFVIGGGNNLAHAAAIAVSENPGFAYNPLFIYGDVGLGKTHLLQGIGLKILKEKSSTKVLYAPAETFLNEMVEAIQFNKNLEFREKYRNYDVLIIDDIQVISGKEKTQDELFHTYNIMYQSNKQIVFAADRPPKEIQNLTDRLRSRFEGGMVADIKAPDFETKLAILKKKADEKNLFLPENLMRLIAELESANIRELEGSLTKLGTMYYLNKNQMSEDQVRVLLKKDFESKRKNVKPRDIIATVAKNFELGISDIKGRRRTANIALARQVAMYLLRTDLGLTLEDCANQVKRKDHTTVIHAVEKISDLVATEDGIAERIGEIKKTYTQATLNTAS